MLESDGLKACNFVKKRLQHKCLPVKFWIFSKTPPVAAYLVLRSNFDPKKRFNKKSSRYWIIEKNCIPHFTLSSSGNDWHTTRQRTLTLSWRKIYMKTTYVMKELMSQSWISLNQISDFTELKRFFISSAVILLLLKRTTQNAFIICSFFESFQIEILELFRSLNSSKFEIKKSLEFVTKTSNEGKERVEFCKWHIGVFCAKCTIDISNIDLTNYL